MPQIQANLSISDLMGMGNNTQFGQNNGNIKKNNNANMLNFD